jgi:NAD dependent epimerase/dehydratase family enzyme
MGNGRQYWPWIAMDDVVGAVQHVADHDSIDEPVNLVAPEAVTSREFARALGSHLGRPAVLPAPAFAIKAAMGEMAEALLLASSRVTPKVLAESGYRFKAPTLAEAFRIILG